MWPARCLKRSEAIRKIESNLIIVNESEIIIDYRHNDQLTAVRRSKVSNELFCSFPWHHGRIELIGVELVVEPVHGIAFFVLVKRVEIFLDTFKRITFLTHLQGSNQQMQIGVQI